MLQERGLLARQFGDGAPEVSDDTIHSPTLQQRLGRGQGGLKCGRGGGVAVSGGHGLILVAAGCRAVGRGAALGDHELGALAQCGGLLL